MKDRPHIPSTAGLTCFSSAACRLRRKRGSTCSSARNMASSGPGGLASASLAATLPTPPTPTAAAAVLVAAVAAASPRPYAFERSLKQAEGTNGRERGRCLVDGGQEFKGGWPLFGVATAEEALYS